MGYVYDFRDAWASEKQIDRRSNRAIVERENRLLLDMLRPHAGESLLEIGCGIGNTLAFLGDFGLRLAGLDPSEPMVDIARQRAGCRVEFHRGVAEDLPFDDNEFHYAVLTGALEFVEDPQQAVAEACRVAKDKLFIGALNRFALRAVCLRLRGILSSTVYNRARFFSLWELKRMVRRVAGNVPISWETVSHLYWKGPRLGPWVERHARLGRYPFGGYTGVVAVLMPRFRARPLELELPMGGKRPSGAVTGYGASRRLSAGKQGRRDAGRPRGRESSRLSAGTRAGSRQ
jgi:ubiquinone/menaquinone biosynthesis C-methylase UbiE